MSSITTATTPSRRRPARQPSSPLTPYSPLAAAEEDDEAVLHTPRRGRRMGGVQMGWDSPSTHDQWSHVTRAPATLPRAAKNQRYIDDSDWTRRLAAASSASVTPRKRRAHDDTEDWIASQQHQTPSKTKAKARARATASLIDHQGFATAAALAPSTPSASSRTAQTASPLFDAPPAAKAKFDPLKAFTIKQEPATDYDAPLSNLVAVDVKGMGRVAVDRAMAARLGAFTEDELRASQAAQAHHTSSDGSRAASSHDGQSTSSLASSSTCPTSLDTPAAYSAYSGRTGCVDPSPSFSLVSHFPASDQGSPSVRSAAKQQANTTAGLDPVLYHRLQLFKDKLLAPVAPAAEGSLRFVAGRPRLGGSASVFEDVLPTLEWPDDDAKGPWSGAGDHIQTQKDTRLQVVARWLDADFDEEDASWAADAEADADATIRNSRSRQQHPMVSKVLRDRSKRDAAERLASSKSMPNLRQAVTPSRRIALQNAITPRRRRGRAGHKSKTASQRHGMARTPKRRGDPFTPSSTGMSAASLIGCHCGAEDEGHMVQCDGCHLWYHSRCVGIRDPETELDDTWFCQPCEGHGVPVRGRGSRVLFHGGGGLSASSPASTVALRHDAPSTAGSMATTTPSVLGTHGGLPAFPRTYASHIGVGTPSAPYLRQRLNSQDQSLQLPVFAQAESPMHAYGRSSTGLAFSSALALAPSPSMEGGGAETLAGAMKKQAGQGRSRAARIGWQSSEPGSPLDRKSSGVFSSAPRNARFRTPSYASKQHQVSNARGHGEEEHGQQVPLRGAGGGHLAASATMSPSFFSSMRNGSGSRAGARDRTPSPSRHATAAVFSTPSRHARSGRSSLAGGDEVEIRDADDVFSTPSRHLPGSSWWGSKNPNAMGGASHGGPSTSSTSASHAGGAPTTPNGAGVAGAVAGFQTPSRSTRRRESSGWGLGLATPGSGRDRDMLFGGGYQSTDVSGGGYSTGGMPSLVFSSGGGIDAVLDDFPAAHWGGGASPSRIASARRRQRSGVDPLSVGGAGSRTLGSRGSATSSLRMSAARHRAASGRGEKVHFDDDDDDDEDDDNLGLDTENEQDPLTSSSPYPRTPSMDLGYGSANRLVGMRSGGGGSASGGRGVGVGRGGTPGSPTPTRGRVASSLGRKSITAASAAGRGVSPGTMDASHGGNANNGFGLGLDLDDVLLDYF